MGHIGLPLGILLAYETSSRVTLVDFNLQHKASVLLGKMPYKEYGIEPVLQSVLDNQLLAITDDYRLTSECDVIIVCIGTPVDEYLSPVLKPFASCIDMLAKNAPRDALIVIRSSIYPGAFKSFYKQLTNKGFKHVAYCPERIVQGHALNELRSLPQIISGYDELTLKKAADLFGAFAPSTIVSSVEEAELSKLFSNAWRYIQFAVANQFSMIASEYGCDFESIRNIMTINYPRNRDLPGSGFTAGPCLYKDTAQLSAFYGNQFQLGQAAISINEGYPSFIVSHYLREFDISKLTVGILGMAFKPGVDDTRDSLSFKLKKILEFKGAKVLCSDAYIDRADWLSADSLVKQSDLIIVATPHPQYAKLNFQNKPVIHASPQRG
jgi:UDP-N-acetyl-D-mannosaminuronic acid dehydrogenase